MGSSIINWLRGSFQGKKMMKADPKRIIDAGTTRLLSWDESAHVDRIDQVVSLYIDHEILHHTR